MIFDLRELSVMPDNPNIIFDEDALLARRFFFGGCLGLPWLWMLNCMYFAPKRNSISVEARRCTF